MPKQPAGRRDLSLAGGDVASRKLTVAEAAKQWVMAKTIIAEQEALRDQAAAALKEYFEKTGRTTYKDKIAYITVPSRVILDQKKVRAFLGKRLSEFQKRTETSKTLQLLK